MSTPHICLVTIHGIGFEQPPIYAPGAAYPTVAGYADDLHAKLSKCLNQHVPLLSDDPHRSRHQPGENGAIYVESTWPSTNQSAVSSYEAGRSRLGTWDPDQPLKIIPNTVEGLPAGLYDDTGRIAHHIALVYSKEEGTDPQPGAGVIAIATALASLGHYGHLVSNFRTFLVDIENLKPAQTQTTPGLRVREDAGALNKPSNAPSSSIGLLRQFENDVAAYVCRNELRERIRGFVLDALLRLACRDDVDGIVINAHSNGTVIAFDVLCQLPPFAAKKILAVITAGSPLRKYTKLFNWGQQMAIIPAIKKWTNFFDPKDLVADPLYTPKDWLVGDADPIEQAREQPTNSTAAPQTVATEYLYQSYDPNTGTHTNIPIQDKSVDNVRYSANAGLIAHNYWDNEVQFIPSVAQLLTELVADSAITPTK